MRQATVARRLPVRQAVAGIAADGTPVNGVPLVITAIDEPFEPTPKGDQTLRLAGSPSGIPTLDPALARDIDTTFVVRQIFRGLISFDSDLQPIPELADRIEITADGLSYKFHLRDGAKFQDGRPISSDDVVSSLTRAMSPATAGGDPSLLGGPAFLSDIVGAQELLSGQVDNLTGVSKVDDQSVEIRLTEPRATFLMKLASVPASIVDRMQLIQGADWWREPNGSGPFHLTKLTDERDLQLAPSDEWFEGAPPMHEVDIALGQSALQPFNLYQSGQVDISPVDLNGVDRALSPESGLNDQVLVTPQLAVEYIAFNIHDEPMTDPHIRRALQLGFPRDKVAEVTYDGYVGKACGLIPDGMLGRNWPCENVNFDLEAAKKEIAHSKYGSADKVPPIEIYTAGSQSTDALRNSIEQSLSLKVDVIEVDWNEFLNGLSIHEYPAYSIYWSADYPDPESLLWTLFSSVSKDNYVDYHNDRFERLLAQAAAEPNEAKRIDLYAQAQQLLLDDGVVMPLYYDVSYTLVRPYVKGLDVTAIGILGFEHIWLER
ncbi:MAG: peptide ABC transporter substrate-binding protein [Thermomicrobiales bacterium]